MSTPTTTPGRGWAWPAHARKAHYFNGDAISLCRRWLYGARDATDTDHANAANCRICMRERERLALKADKKQQKETA